MIACPICNQPVPPGEMVTATPERPIAGKPYACGPCHTRWRATLVEVLDAVSQADQAFASTMIAAARSYRGEMAYRAGNLDGVDRAVHAAPTRIPDQPAPVAQPGRRAAWDLVIWRATSVLANDDPESVQPVLDDMRERHRVGIERYGVPLTGGNGRDCLLDAYQEGLDFAAYLAARLDELGAFDSVGRLAAAHVTAGILYKDMTPAQSDRRQQARALIAMLDDHIGNLVDLRNIITHGRA